MGTFSDYLHSILTSTKASKFRAGFIKKDGSYREGTFDLKDRKTWKQKDGTMYKRKGKKRTTKADEYILAHDLDKKDMVKVPESATLSGVHPQENIYKKPDA